MELAHKLFSSRSGTIVFGGFAALLAAIAVFVYVHNYRSSVSAGGTPATVLVAKSLIQKGTPGTVIATKQLFQATTIRESQLREGAYADPAGLAGRVAAQDIYPGQQLTATDFVTAPNTLASKLPASQRAITIPFDSAHGLIGAIGDGDRVDVYAGFTVIPVDAAGRPLANGGQTRQVLRLIMQNVPVLAVAGKHSGLAASGSTTNVTLRVSPSHAAQLAFASDNGKLWLVLRAPSGATASPPSLVTVETMLLGVPPLQALRSFGGRR
jgi:Flp pilus assembly protein CpaB